MLAAVALAQSEQRHPAESSKAASEQHPAGASTLAEKACARAEQATNYDPQHHDDWDLCAQFLSAEAAANTGDFARPQFLLSLGGLAAILATLVFTGIQANAAVRGNKQSRLSAERQLRAYVAFRGIEHEQHKPGGDIFLRPVWKNTGSTPTRHLAICGGHAFYQPVALPADFDYPDDKGKEPGWSSLGGGIEEQVNGPIIKAERILDIKTKKARLYIWGWAEYSDVFDVNKRYRTEFCVLWGPRPDDNGSITIIHGAHNGTDDECLKPVHTTKRPKPKQ